MRAGSSDFAVSVVTNQNTKFEDSGGLAQFTHHAAFFAGIHSRLADIFSRMDLKWGDRTDTFLAIPIVLFLQRTLLLYMLVYLKFNFC